jgi:type VI secretion system secreted protein VgrG
MPRVIEAITPLAAEDLIFHAMTGTEALSTLFDFSLTLVSELISIAPKTLLGQDITLAIETEDQGTTRYLSGLCTRFALVGRHNQYHVYRADLKPWLWLASRRSDSKIFQQMKVPDIIESVLARYGFPVKRALSGTYRLWDYCVQYHETDLSFVSRLMEHEGIYYYFEHSAGKHVLVLCDGASSHKPLAPRSSINFVGLDAAAVERDEHFYTWRPREEIDPGEYITNDYDFTRPKAELTTKDRRVVGHTFDSWERYLWPGGYTDIGDGETYARTRRESLQSEQTRATGEGNLRTLAPGYLMTLARCPRSEQNGEHLIVGVRYELKSNAHGMADLAAKGVEWDFATLTQPASIPYRPQLLTPKPRSHGPQVAVVVGPPGEEIYTDEYGRVKVQFPWDRYGQNNQHSSCWMRVSHPWAGSNYGAIHIPRIGQEVIVDHIDGDPDYPLVTGRVYNADQMPPWALPDNKTQSGILTRSSKGGATGAGKKAEPGDANAIRFEDKKGEEQLWLHAQKDQLTEVENDETKWVGRDRRKTIDRDELNHIQRDRTETVDRNETITVHGWRDEEVDGNETITIHSNRKERVDHNESISIGDNRSEDVGKNETIKIGSNRTETVGSNEKVKIGRNQNLTVGSSKTELIKLMSTKTVGIAQMTNIGAGYMLNVGAAWMTNVGFANIEHIGKIKKVSVGETTTFDSGKSTAISAGETIAISAGKSIVIQAGDTSITLDADSGTIILKAKKIKIDGDEIVDVDSRKIDLN